MQLVSFSNVLLLTLLCCLLSVVVASRKSIRCSLNGRSQQSDETTTTDYSCICKRPWKGPQCEYLDFLPVEFPQGYGMYPNQTSWGGNILHDTETDLYHIFVSTMTNGCSLAHWTKNSRIDHGVSKYPTGPFLFRDVAVSTFAHNSAPIKIPNNGGGYAIFHIGTGEGPIDGGIDCRATTNNSILHPRRSGISNVSSYSRRDLSSSSSLSGVGSTIHVSQSLDGPWSPLTNNTLKSCNNPSPFYHPFNESLFIACNHNDILRSNEGIHGPWTKVVTIDTSKGPEGHYEDPYLWIDEELNFHILFHVYRYNENPPHGHDCTNSMVSAHAFSKDGLEWHFGSDQPYTTQIPIIRSSRRDQQQKKKKKNVSSDNIITVATRERPFLMWNTRGQMTHLVTAVCGAAACPTGPPEGCVDCKYDWWDYTLVAPLAISEIKD